MGNKKAYFSRCPRQKSAMITVGTLTVENASRSTQPRRGNSLYVAQKNEGTLGGGIIEKTIEIDRQTHGKWKREKPYCTLPFGG